MYLLHGLAVISNRRKYHACNYSCSKYKVYMHFSVKHLALKKLRRCVYISRCKHAIRNHISKCPWSVTLKDISTISPQSKSLAINVICIIDGKYRVKYIKKKETFNWLLSIQRYAKDFTNLFSTSPKDITHDATYTRFTFLTDTISISFSTLEWSILQFQYSLQFYNLWIK